MVTKHSPDSFQHRFLSSYEYHNLYDIKKKEDDALNEASSVILSLFLHTKTESHYDVKLDKKSSRLKEQPQVDHKCTKKYIYLYFVNVFFVPF